MQSSHHASTVRRFLLNPSTRNAITTGAQMRPKAQIRPSYGPADSSKRVGQRLAMNHNVRSSPITTFSHAEIPKQRQKVGMRKQALPVGANRHLHECHRWDRGAMEIRTGFLALCDSTIGRRETPLVSL